MHDTATFDECGVRKTPQPHRRERGVRLVVLLTALTMTIEIVVGYATNSLALLADGWHMATHVGALGLASAAYWAARRFAGHPAFVFGTGKVHALAGYTSAVALGLVAVVMGVESLERLLRPHEIDFVSSLPVAVLGLFVNIVSVLLLNAHDANASHVHDAHAGHVDGDRAADSREAHPEHAHHPSNEHHDHNHRAAFVHVVADTFTSGLAIVALMAGRFFGWNWLDAVSGLIGGLVILHWSAGLLRSAAFELLDVASSSNLEDEIRVTLEALDDVRVRDLHVWSIGGDSKSCVVTVVTATPRDALRYREALARFRLVHLTIEVQRCAEGHDDGAQTAAE
jgi:cation diffusion facilitator family transporter